ncbi:molybdate ABC transporter substrate-binding protein [Corynebacterium ciconiae]|uniref:molybdate ABC transporter substrate-binding protein n=1 Tax=Corynebacterium ciconiae TaxID=227319 RepID=UPI00142EBCCE|nr:molybdate ABC transporter substrate-binding protein [Corynebacterium ciconiae]
MRRFLTTLTSVLAAAGVLSACSSNTADAPSPDATQLDVFAAASTRVLSDDFADLAAELDRPAELVIQNAGSSALVQQLVDGAPADVLITADERTMNQAVNQGVVEAPEVVASNYLVLVVPADNTAGITGFDESLLDATVVVCDEQVPCGAASARLIDAALPSLTPASLEANVTDTLGKVTSGGADAALVYASDALAAGDAVRTFDIPGADAAPNHYLAAVVSTSEKKEEAADFLKALRSTAADEAWSNHGFNPVTN